MTAKNYYDIKVKYQGEEQLARLYAHKIELRQLSIVVPFDRKNAQIAFRLPLVILIEDKKKNTIELPVNRLTLSLLYPLLELYIIVLFLLAVCSFGFPFFIFGQKYGTIMPLLTAIFSVFINITLASFFLLQLHENTYKKGLNILLLNTVLSFFLMFKFSSFMWFILLFYVLPFLFLFASYFINKNSFLLKKLFFVFSWWQSVVLTFPLLLFFLFFSFDVAQWQRKIENIFAIEKKQNTFSLSFKKEKFSWHPLSPLTAQKFSFSRFLFFSFFSNYTFSQILLTSPQFLLSYFDHRDMGFASVYPQSISQTLEKFHAVFQMKQFGSMVTITQEALMPFEIEKYKLAGQAFVYQASMMHLLTQKKSILFFVFFQKENSDYTLIWQFDFPIDSNSSILLDTIFKGLKRQH